MAIDMLALYQCALEKIFELTRTMAPGPERRGIRCIVRQVIDERRYWALRAHERGVIVAAPSGPISSLKRGRR
jgi:hypothetical protein